MEAVLNFVLQPFVKLRAWWTDTYICRFSVATDAKGQKCLAITFRGRKAITDMRECLVDKGFLFRGVYFSNNAKDFAQECTIDPDDDQQ